MLSNDDLETGVSPAADKIQQTARDGIGIITFNNPARHNAMSLEMWIGLGEAVNGLAADPAVRVIILRGAGGKAFVSGADISQFDELRYNAEATRDYASRSGVARQALEQCLKPTIACIDGFCLGGGLLIAMLADIRIAAAASSFGIPAAKLGVAYGYQGLERLVALVGPSRASLLMFTGVRIDAVEALRIGLIDQTVSQLELWPQTMQLARTIADNAPLAIAAAKLSIVQVLKDACRRDMEAVRQIETVCADSEDCREGRRAFAEKRKPVFCGR
jgi:enoyl-CoA hydratase